MASTTASGSEAVASGAATISILIAGRSMNRFGPSSVRISATSKELSPVHCPDVPSAYRLQPDYSGIVERVGDDCRGRSQMAPVEPEQDAGEEQTEHNERELVLRMDERPERRGEDDAEPWLDCSSEQDLLADTRRGEDEHIDQGELR